MPVVLVATMATIGRNILLTVACGLLLLQATECAPGHNGKNMKNCDLPVLLTQLRNEVHQEQRQPIAYVPVQQQHIPELLSDISNILMQSGQGDVIASNLGSGVNNVQDSSINVLKNGYGGGGDFIASNAGSGVNNVEGSAINVMKGPPQYIHSSFSQSAHLQSTYGPQYNGDVIASNMGSGVNSVQDSAINVLNNGYGGGGDFIASNSGSGVNNVEGSAINVMKGPAQFTGTTYAPQYTRSSYAPQYQGDVIASNTGSGVNNVKDSLINVAKEGYGGAGDFIASNSGSGVNNVEGSSINVMKGPAIVPHHQQIVQSTYSQPQYAQSSYVPQYQGDVIASNTGSGVNSVQDSAINVLKNGYGGGGDFIASNSGSGVNNVERSAINVMKGPTQFVATTYAPQYTRSSYAPQYQGDVIASNMGSGVNNVKDSLINVAKEGYGGAGDFIASNSGSGVNNVEGSSINVMKGPAIVPHHQQIVQSTYSQPHYVQSSYVPQYQGDVIASNTGSGVNSVQDSAINVLNNGYGGGGDFIASNSGSGVNNVEGSAINVMKGPTQFTGTTYAPQYTRSSYAPQYQGDVIASNMGSGVNNVKDSLINVAKEGYGGAGDFIASNSGPGVNNVEGSSINVMKGPAIVPHHQQIVQSTYSQPHYVQSSYVPQYQGDVIASNTGSGVNSVQDSAINVLSNGHGGGGDFIASNSGSGVNNVEGSAINVMKGPAQFTGTTYAPQYSRSSYAPQYQGDVIASNMGSGVNNVKDSLINVAKEGYGGASDFIASNSGSGVNNVEGSAINVMKGPTQFTGTTYAPQYTRSSYAPQYQGDVIASNMGSGVNNVKDSLINVAKEGYGGAGDFIASNSGSGVNNVEGSSINVMKGPAIIPYHQQIVQSTYSQPHYAQSSYVPQYQGDVIASNTGSGVNSVQDSAINVLNNGYGGGGDFIASNSGSGVNNVEGSAINVMKGPTQFTGTTYAPQYTRSSYAPQYQGDVIASNTGSGVNNVKDSLINVAKEGYGGAGDFIASNSGSGVNNVEGSSINVMKGPAIVPHHQHFVQSTNSQPQYIQSGYVPQYQSDVIASNMGSGVNNVKESAINVVKEGYGSGGDFIASNTGSGVNNVEGSAINVMKNGPSIIPQRQYVQSSYTQPQYIQSSHVPQYEGDTIASNIGSGVNSVKDSTINIAKNGYVGGGGDFIASNAGSGVNNVEGSQMNVMKAPQYVQQTTWAPQVSTQKSNILGSIHVVPNLSGTASGDVIGSNTGSGVNNVENSDIFVIKDQQGGNVIASNTGSGTNNVQGSKISVVGGGGLQPTLTTRPVTIFEQMGTANIQGHRVPVMKQEQGDIIASNMGSGVNNVKDSSIVIVKDGAGSGGDIVASNMGSGVNNVEGSSINVMKGSSFHRNTNDGQVLAQFVSTHRPQIYQTSGDVIASNLGSGVNNIKDSSIMVMKDGSTGGDFIASNGGSGVNNVEGSNIGVFKNAVTSRPMYIEPVTVYESIGSVNVDGYSIPVLLQEQGDIIASNMGSGVNNVKDSTINVIKNEAGSGGDFIASNMGSGVNNVEGSAINVMKGYQQPMYNIPQQNYGYVQTQNERPKGGAIHVVPNALGTSRGDLIASNTGTGVNNVEDSDIFVVKDQSGGNVIASNTGSGTNNVQGSLINVAGGGSSQPMFTARPVTIFENMGTANINGHRVPVMMEEHGDIIASNMGSGINNVKDSAINVMKNGGGGGGGDFIASNAGSGVNNVEGSQINVMKGPAITQQPVYLQTGWAATSAPAQVAYYPQGDTIASNFGSGVNNVKDSEINVMKNGGGSGGDFIASNAGSGVNNVEGSTINVMKNQGAPTPFQHYVATNTGSMPVQSYGKYGTTRGDTIASNTGSGVNNVEDSEIFVVSDQYGGGNTIASNTGSGTNSVQGSQINVAGGGIPQPMFTARPVTIFENMGTANINGHRVPVMMEEHGDIIASNMGSGVNNVKDSVINVMKNGGGGGGGGDFIASNAGSGVNNVEGSSINVIKNAGYNKHYEEEEVCEDLQDSDVINVKDILKTILFGETANTKIALDNVGVILNQINDLHRLKTILKTIHPKYNWDISNKELKQDILRVLAHPLNTDFSRFINGLYDYKLGANGGINALFHLLGYTNPDATRQFDLNVVLNTLYPGHTSILHSGTSNIFDHANGNGYLNTLNSGSTGIINQGTPFGHANILNSGNTAVINHDTASSQRISGSTGIVNVGVPMVYRDDAPGCELFQYLKAKFPQINEKYIERAVLNMVSNYLTQHELYNQVVRVTRSIESQGN